MIRDRGSVKWVSMMLPEHVQQIRAWKHESEEELPNELTEWELEELQQTIQFAYDQKLIVTLKTMVEHNLSHYTGIITVLKTSTRELSLETDTTIRHIPLNAIYRAQLENNYCD
ncbi:YolD-like family protein [Viridibacillus arvi]|uniref:YolD-like family protein n=1 Tax=Viridibacillus arvi TaxID=263475 RepID=UPI003D072C98